VFSTRLIAAQVVLCSSLEPGKVRKGKVNELFVYDNFNRVQVDEVKAGDICAFTGIGDIGVSHWGSGARQGVFF
jgi:predicted membrane GTPase involved in stress response